VTPQQHWRSYGSDPLPTPTEALGEPFAAFPVSPRGLTPCRREAWV
jgi:hypothetical protein